MPTRDDIYAAIRNADKAGDSAAVRKLGEYLQTLPTEEMPAAAPPAMDHSKRIAEIDAELKQLETEKPGTIENTWGVVKNFAKGAGDVALNLGAPMVTTPVAGVAGAATTLATAPFVGKDRAVELGNKVIDNTASVGGLVRPYSDVGQQAMSTISKPLEKLATGADWAGQKAVDATGSPLVGAIVNTATQALPAIILRKGGPLSRVRVGAATEAAESAAATAGVTTPATAKAASVARARDYVANTLRVDWDSLAQPIRDKLSAVARDATALDNLDPAAVTRELKLQSLPVPVPATRGQLSGDRVAIRNEGNASATKAGQPIADIHIAANQALLDNLDVLKRKVSGTGQSAATATTPEQAGAVVQGALRQGEALSKADYKAAYKVPDTMAADAVVSAQPLYDLLEGRPDIQRLGFLQSWLNKAKITKTTSTDGVTVAEQRPVSVAELRDLKEQAGEIKRTGGTDGLYAGKVYDAVQDAIKEHPEIKAAYDTADAKFSTHKIKYEDQAAVGDLVSDASRTDRTTALSNTVRAVTSGAPEEIRQIKRTLLTGGDEATRTAGRQAWREVRAQVIQQIKDDATRGVGIVEGGQTNLTPSALNTAIRRFGPQKLDEIFGGGTTRQLNAILDAAKTVKSIPSTGGGSVGSSTVQNALALLEKGLIAGATKVPVVGKIVGGALQAASDIGSAARTTKTATTTPLSEALAKAKRKQILGTGKQLDPTLVPLSQIGAQRSRG